MIFGEIMKTLLLCTMMTVACYAPPKKDSNKSCTIENNKFLGKTQVCIEPARSKDCIKKTITPLEGKFAGKSQTIIKCPASKNMFSIR